jgi:hypothetical protein
MAGAVARPALFRRDDDGPPRPPDEQLKREIELAVKYSYNHTRLCTVLYYGMRLTLIVLSYPLVALHDNRGLAT